jgi:hypothetical protein
MSKTFFDKPTIMTPLNAIFIITEHVLKWTFHKSFLPAAGPAQSRTSKVSSEAVSSAGSFQSHLPRPLTVGRSASSGSSTGGGAAAAPPEAHSPRQRARKSLSIESLNNTNDEEENLLADCIFSGEDLCLACRVADPHHFNADPDPAFHFNANSDPASSLLCGSGSSLSL